MGKETVICAHHFLIDDDDRGICKLCGIIKVFTIEYINPKLKKRYWEISYEDLKEKEYERLEIEDEWEIFN